MATETGLPSVAALCVAGALSLAIAMGIGRFAFTPVLPLMIGARQLDVAVAGWIAAANYVGYLAGALTASGLPWRATELALAGLMLTIVLTAAMAWPGPWLWGAWRFIAGMASAWVFVATTVWCLGGLAKMRKPQAAGFVYAGVGAGIALAGVVGWAAGVTGVTPANLWLQLALLALALSVPVVYVLRRIPAPARSVATASGSASRVPSGLVLSYGVMGFGYILPATFLPVLARSVAADPSWFGLAWPVFGVVAALSAIVAGWWLRRRPRTEVWAVCQALMGIGTLVPSLWTHSVAIVMSALLVGGTFMIITLAGVQEARARTPGDPRGAVGRMTAAFAIGQIAGPVMSALLFNVGPQHAHGLDIGLQVAAVSLFATAAWLLRDSRAPRLPMEDSHAR